MSDPLDDALDALAHAQRRRLLTALLEHESQVVSPAASGAGAGPDGDSVALRHTHLPKLDADGFVDWDRERGEVSRGPAFEEIRPLLELLIEHEDALPGRWL